MQGPAICIDLTGVPDAKICRRSDVKLASLSHDDVIEFLVPYSDYVQYTCLTKILYYYFPLVILINSESF